MFGIKISKIPGTKNGWEIVGRGRMVHIAGFDVLVGERRERWWY